MILKEKKILWLLFFTVFLLFLAGCVSSFCPYRIFSGGNSSGVISPDGNFIYDFYFLNESTKDIVSFSVELSLFDSDGEPVFSAGCIHVVFESDLRAGEERFFEIRIGDYIDTDPETVLVADYFFVSRIRYEDGSVWTDDTGIFCRF